MNPAEYAIMARAEEAHWWYQGLRGFLDAVIARHSNILRPGCRILDAGCGTGGNLLHLASSLDPSWMGGFDFSQEALDFARNRLPKATLWQDDIRSPSLPEQGFDLVISMDVVYIPGLEESLAGLRRLAQALNPGGLLILNLPAYNWLFSEHDLAVHTSERYTRRRLQHLPKELDLIPVLTTYRVCLLFPAVVLARLPDLVRKLPPQEEAVSDISSILPSPLNRFLSTIMRLENRLIQIGASLPWGSSVSLVLQKPA